MRLAMWLVALGCAAPGIALGQPYASAHLGYSSADFPLGAPFNGVLDDRSITYGFDVGFGFSDRWAAEFGMSRYGPFDGRGTPCASGATCPLIVEDIGGNDLWLYRLALVPRFNVGPVHLFAKAGYYRANIDTDVALPDNDFDESGLVLGAGVRLYFRDPWHVAFEATRYDDNITQVTIGVGWGVRFGPDLREYSASVRPARRGSRAASP